MEFTATFLHITSCCVGSICNREWGIMSCALFLRSFIVSMVVQPSDKWSTSPLRKWQQQAVEELVRNWPGADGSEGIPKLFQHTVSCSVYSLTSPRACQNNGYVAIVCVSLMKWMLLTAWKKETYERKKSYGMMPERLHPSLQSSAKVANVS